MLPDKRQKGKVIHSNRAMLAQRVLALAQGYEDLNDHDTLRHELLLQSAVGSERTLAWPVRQPSAAWRTELSVHGDGSQLAADLFGAWHGEKYSLLHTPACEADEAAMVLSPAP